MQSQIWSSSIPLHITHNSSPTPYLIAVPRLSYLPLLLPRLTSFFGPASSFSYQQILLKNLPVGLLYDLYQPELPWRLELGHGPLFDIHDTYINSVKEVSLATYAQILGWSNLIDGSQADFIRNGTAKGIMSMSRENSTELWNSVQDSVCLFFSLNRLALANILTR
jgi:autophagy-related protein 5